MFICIVGNFSFQFTLPNLSFRHIDDAPVDRWPTLTTIDGFYHVEYEPYNYVQNAGPESRQLRVPARLAWQWMKERGIICMTIIWVHILSGSFGSVVDKRTSLRR